MPNLLSSDQLSKDMIERIFALADECRSTVLEQQKLLPNIGALLFFEASTRTRIGFEVAAWKLGVKTVLMQETKFNESMSGAESISDTIRTLNPYVSFFCVRHPDETIMRIIAENTEHPVINCGNGADEHPTQGLADAYTIWKKFGKISGLKISLIGCLRYSRAAHSLVRTLGNFSDIHLETVSPSDLMLENSVVNDFIKNGNTHKSFVKPKWRDQDVVYSAGFPPETPAGHFDAEAREAYMIDTDDVIMLGDNTIVMNPLPRIDEINSDVDSMPQAHYFTQNENALYIRMAVLKYFCLQ